MRCLRSTKSKIFLTVSIIIVAIVFVTVLGVSFSGIEYYEYGFYRRKSTGNVDTTNVFTGGKYFIGPDAEFKIFRSDAHFLELNEIDVFTRDKLEVEITVHIQYFLRKDELNLLHNSYDLAYEDVMRSSAIDALKGAIPVFSTKELISKRQEVESVIFKAVRDRLGGTCCRFDCSVYGENVTDCNGCVPRSECKVKDKGLNVDVRYLQLTDVDIPDDVQDRYMESLVLQEKVLREDLYQNASLIRKTTEAMVNELENNATEIKQNAQAEADKILAIAEAEYVKTIEAARVYGLKLMFDNLGITEQEKKDTFNYLYSLRGSDKVHLTVDFQQRIAGTF